MSEVPAQPCSQFVSCWSALQFVPEPRTSEVPAQPCSQFVSWWSALQFVPEPRCTSEVPAQSCPLRVASHASSTPTSMDGVILSSFPNC